MYRWIYNIDAIGFPICLLYLLIRIGLSSISKGVFKNLGIFLVHLVLRRAKAFALELAKVVVLTLYPLYDKVYRIVKLFPPINQLKSTSNISIPSNPKEESSFRGSLFLTPLGSRLHPPSVLPLSCLYSLMDSPSKDDLPSYKRSKLPYCLEPKALG
jgi:hypothetical protein